MKISIFVSILLLVISSKSSGNDQPYDVIFTAVEGIPQIVDTNNMGKIQVANEEEVSNSVSFAVRIVGRTQADVEDYTRKYDLDTEITGLNVKLIRKRLMGVGGYACTQILGKVAGGACEVLVTILVPKGYGATVLGRLVGISTDKEVAQATKAKTISNGQARLLAQVMADANGDYDQEKLAKDFAARIIEAKQVKISPTQMGIILSKLNYDSKKIKVLSLFVNYLVDRQATVPVVQSLLTGSDKDRARNIILGLPAN